MVVIELSDDPRPVPGGPSVGNPFPRWARHALALVVLLPFVGISSSANVATIPTTAARAADSDAVLLTHLDPDRPGCSAAVAVDGEVAWAGARGVADLASGAAITPDTLFEIGGVSDQFTAAVVLLLAHDGALSLDDTVDDHVPGLPDWAGQVTIDHLLHQTSGIPDHLYLLGRGGHDVSRTTTRRDALGALTGIRELNFEPGRWHDASRSNQLLLTEVVRTVSGTAPSEVLQNRLFGPLGLTMVTKPAGGAVVSAVSYQDDGRGPQLADTAWDQIDTDRIRTTPTELVRWADNYRTGRVGGQRLLNAQLANPARDLVSTEFTHGAGIVIGPGATLWRFGGLAGFAVHFEILPDRHTAFALACNSTHLLPEPMVTIGAGLRKIWT